MLVREVIASALILLGRAELASALASGAGAEEEKDLTDTLLYCFNAVENEIARNYIPLVYREELLSKNNKFLYTSFSKTPLRVKKISGNGRSVNYEIFPDYLYAEAEKIDIEYEYAPRRKRLDDATDFNDSVCTDIIPAGMAEEYSYINGEAEAGDIWKVKYRDLIDDIQRTLPECAHIPPRRWV